MTSIIYNQKELLHLGAKIAEARHQRGEKAETVAKAIGLPQSAISRIEHGCYVGLKMTTVLRLCAYLKISIEIPPPYVINLFNVINKIYLIDIKYTLKNYTNGFSSSTFTEVS